MFNLNAGSPTSYDSFRAEEENVYVNGNPVRHSDKIRRYVIDVLGERARCPYCSLPMVFADSTKGLNDEDESGRISSLGVCPKCGFWQWYHNEWGWRSVAWSCWVSKVRTFDSLPPDCHSEIAQSIIRNPMLLHSMNPPALEKHVTAVFKANFGACEVMHVGQPYDGGVDVLLIESGGLQTLIQVKRRSDPNAAEGVDTIRNLLGVMTDKDVLRGVVVATVDHFTYSASEMARRNNRKGYKIDLVDKGRLLRMMPALLPQRPWRAIVRNNAPNLNGFFTRELRAQGISIGTLAGSISSAEVIENLE